MNITYEYFCSFPANLRFKCLPHCALCCSLYKIPLTQYDIDRLNKAQKTEGRDCITLLNQGGGDIAGFINNGEIKGCSYLSDDLRCSIYSDRPLYCRTFPFIRDLYFTLEMSVDYSCPGIGCGDLIEKEAIEEMFLIELKNRGNRINIEKAFKNFSFTVSALKSRNIYTEYEYLIYVSNELIEKYLIESNSFEITRSFKSLAEQSEQVLQDRGNILSKEDSENIADELIDRSADQDGIPDRSVRALFSSDDKSLKICLFGQKIPHYELSCKNNCFYVSGRNMDKQLYLADIRWCEISREAVKKLSGYLSVWLSRQSLLRFTHSLGLSSLKRTNIFRYYFDFISFTAERVLLTAEILTKLNKEVSISKGTMKEAIRSNDNVLRSKCLSMITVN